MRLARPAFINFLVVVFSLSALYGGTVSFLGGGQERQRDDRYGLYYAEWKGRENALSLVISPDGRAIAPKANDRCAD